MSLLYRGSTVGWVRDSKATRRKVLGAHRYRAQPEPDAERSWAAGEGSGQ